MVKLAWLQTRSSPLALEEETFFEEEDELVFLLELLEEVFFEEDELAFLLELEEETFFELLEGAAVPQSATLVQP